MTKPQKSKAKEKEIASSSAEIYNEQKAALESLKEKEVLQHRQLQAVISREKVVREEAFHLGQQLMNVEGQRDEGHRQIMQLKTDVMNHSNAEVRQLRAQLDQMQKSLRMTDFVMTEYGKTAVGPTYEEHKGYTTTGR